MYHFAKIFLKLIMRIDNKAIVDRLKAVFKVNSNRELAKTLGVVDSAITNWTSGRSEINFNRIFTHNAIDGINMNWLMLGVGPMRMSDLGGDSKFEKAGRILYSVLGDLIEEDESSKKRNPGVEVFSRDQVRDMIHTVYSLNQDVRNLVV